TLRMVARYADIWNYGGGPPEEFRRLSAILDEHCAAIGRDPASIERSVQVGTDPDALASLREPVRAFIQAGATHLVFYLLSPQLDARGRDLIPPGIVARLAREVAEPLRAEFAEPDPA